MSQLHDEVGVVQADAEPEPVGSKAEQLMKLAWKLQAERGWDLTRAWAEASQQRPDLMSAAKHESLPGTDASAVTARYTEIGFIK